MAKVSIREMIPGDDAVCIHLIEQEDWDCSWYDFRAYNKHPPNVVFVAVDQYGKQIGFISLNEKTADLVYVYGFIVEKDLRRQGIGRKLWLAMLGLAGGRNMVLDSVSPMMPWYEKQGFRLRTFSMLFCKFVVTEDMKINNAAKDFHFEVLTADKWQDLLEYDKLVFPSYNRESELKAWYIDECVKVILSYNHGKVVGCGSVHRKPNGQYGLRNVFAESEAIAEGILRKLLEALPIATVVRCMLVDGKPILPVIEGRLDFSGTLVRKFTKTVIEEDLNRIWIANLF